MRATIRGAQLARKSSPVPGGEARDGAKGTRTANCRQARWAAAPAPSSRRNQMVKPSGTYADPCSANGLPWEGGAKGGRRCRCGCGERIRVAARHFRAGIPWYLRGHPFTPTGA
jgi:hypothetical protein